jgi:hypothetical protein
MCEPRPVTSINTERIDDARLSFLNRSFGTGTMREQRIMNYFSAVPASPRKTASGLEQARS